ncbi:hypothetical protein F5Y19DRAFT_445822 [Neofusicoccum parvum]|uniref:Uncharacterized protein n=1 Tax=Neofusicoccum parvum TaxID=310453 RepID=A0ACB5SBZ6_9PEZI|nr:hypothetical protein F5Y19DRAFT_445822 [Neofusicoccum parvum]
MYAEYAATCPDHQWETHIFSTDPLIVYIENYLAFEETQYLLNLVVPYHMRSPVFKDYNLDAYDPEIRSSISAVVPNDPVVSCIEKRSVDFQRYMPVSHLEDIQIVKYEVGDQFRPHFHWFSGMENPRLSTIFVYLACDDCRGGNTQFPDFSGRLTTTWCRFVDCVHDFDDGVGGVGFKPITGNAVFWSNLYPNGTDHPGVWHAGMPVKRGRKIGLNIFTRRDPMTPGVTS